MNNNQTNQNPIGNIINKSLSDLPTPSQINYFWNFGSILGICTIAQVLTGIVLATQYTASLSETFESVIHISRDTNNGYIIRFLHLNTASLLFLLAYSHMARGMANNSPNTNNIVWSTGMIVLIVLIATAFLGYVLPWGQISFWGATVITNIFSAIPYLGNTLVNWLWGGFSVGQPTLTRFFALHFLLPMIIIILIIVHLTTLHQNGSSNPTGSQSQIENTNFHPYFSSNDTPPIIISMMVVYTIITQWPLILGDNENSNEANPLTTPLHIQPEWYFLFAYAILRAIPSNLGGVIALAASLLVFLAPTTNNSNQNQTNNSPLQNTLMLSLLGSLVILTWIGANPVEPPYEIVGQISSMLYFLIIATVCIN